MSVTAAVLTLVGTGLFVPFGPAFQDGEAHLFIASQMFLAVAGAVISTVGIMSIIQKSEGVATRYILISAVAVLYMALIVMIGSTAEAPITWVDILILFAIVYFAGAVVLSLLLQERIRRRGPAGNVEVTLKP